MNPSLFVFSVWSGENPEMLNCVTDVKITWLVSWCWFFLLFISSQLLWRSIVIVCHEPARRSLIWLACEYVNKYCIYFFCFDSVLFPDDPLNFGWNVFIFFAFYWRLDAIIWFCLLLLKLPSHQACAVRSRTRLQHTVNPRVCRYPIQTRVPTVGGVWCKMLEI